MDKWFVHCLAVLQEVLKNLWKIFSLLIMSDYKEVTLCQPTVLASIGEKLSTSLGLANLGSWAIYGYNSKANDCWKESQMYITWKLISCWRMIMLSSLLRQQASSVGKSTAVKLGSLKYCQGKLHSCCNTLGTSPLCITIWKSKMVIYS